jgi:2-keto-4-pentenoate hydratase
MIDEALAEGAAYIVERRISHEAIERLPCASELADESVAYRLQRLVHDRRVGMKIGCTTSVMQRYLDIDHPCYGGVFQSQYHERRAQLSSSDFRRLGVECELAVRLERDLPPREDVYRRDEVASAIGEVCAAIEVVDDRYGDWQAVGTLGLIADDFFAAGCVMGEPALPLGAEGMSSVRGRMSINGHEVGHGVGRDILGDPLVALGWIANRLRGDDRGLQCGEFVLLGSLVKTHWLAVGDRVEIELEGLAPVSLDVVT